MWATAIERRVRVIAFALLPLVFACASVPKTTTQHAGPTESAPVEGVEAEALAAGDGRLMHDGLGSVVGRLGSGLYRYDAWGSFRAESAPGSGEPTLAYAGQHWDADLGLSYAQQRWYQPETGRFLSEDPVGATNERLVGPARLHAFGYGNANPMRFVDPYGEDGFDSFKGCYVAFFDNVFLQNRGADDLERYEPDFQSAYETCDWGNHLRNSNAGLKVRSAVFNSEQLATETGCTIGLLDGFVPGRRDGSGLDESLQSSFAACSYASNSANTVMSGRGMLLRTPQTPGLVPAGASGVLPASMAGSGPVAAPLAFAMSAQKSGAARPPEKKSKAAEEEDEEDPDSKELRRRLEDREGKPAPEGAAAHHIVAGKDERAEIAREILRENNIPINSADNGVFLPCKKNSLREGCLASIASHG